VSEIVIIIVVIVVIIVVVVIVVVITIIIIIIIILIIGKTGRLEPYPSLEDSAKLHPVFISLNFTTVTFLQSNISLTSKPPT
jgi:hypothetical protein